MTPAGVSLTVQRSARNGMFGAPTQLLAGWNLANVTPVVGNFDADLAGRDDTNTIADGVAGRVPIAAVLDDLLAMADDAVLAHEASIVAGFAGRHVATIICGSNVDLDAYQRWVRK